MITIEKEKQSKLKELLIESGATSVGFASLNYLLGLDTNYASGISILVKLKPEIIAETGNGPTAHYCEEYSRVNFLLDNLTCLTSDYLTHLGYLADMPGATVRMSDLDNFKVNIPHKTLATLSGLGWIGKNALLITEKYGSAVRLGSVFTNAVFEYDDPITEVKCGNCMKCKNVCPGNAIMGKNWYQDINLDEFYNARLCRKTINNFVSKDINKAICGICNANCPYTAKYINRDVD